jgi:cysteine-rich repeat protein
MNPAVFNIAGAIRIFQCENALCEKSQLTAWNHVTSVIYDAATYRASIVTDGAAFVSNTWYRVVVADWITSSVSSSLSESGSNYGTPENKFYPGAFSWKFKSKDSLTSCAVDRVGLSPKSAILKYVGQRQEYNAIAYGAPDECSVTGQALQASGWGGWGATDTPNKIGAASYVIGADHKYNEITAFLLNNGSLALTNTLPKMCGGNCLYTGNPIKVGQAVCGNGAVNYGESCDDGNTNDKDGCSSSCLKEGTVAPTCGNNVVDAGEQCDDGKVLGGDGCSAKCLFEGVSSIKSICGDGVADNSKTNGGEACDDGNIKEGDGCSSNCLFEGGVVAYSNARCGDGIASVGETCDPGTHCADGAVCTIGGAACQDGSKCEVRTTVACTDLCLNRGTSPGKDPAKFVCGNGITDSGEDAGCDLGVGSIAPGCSKSCLKMGSNPNYAIPSVCGNGGALEPGEQCEAAASATYTVGAYGVAEVSSGASLEVEKDEKKATYGYAVSNVQVSVGGKTGTGEVKLLCSCASDNQCGTKTGESSKSLGCGVEKCCFERPTITAMVPGNNATNICRNTAISIAFDQEMDASTFGSVDTDGDGKLSAAETDPNLQLELITK